MSGTKISYTFLMEPPHFFGKIAVKALIVKDGTVLIVRDRRDADTWEFPGGRINEQEGMEEALHREAQEEIGVDITIGRLVDSSQGIHGMDGNPYLFVAFEATLVEPSQPLSIPSDELAEAKWIGPDAIDEQRMNEQCRHALLKYWNL